MRGGLAVAVILVGALLAATTGVVAAAVISMGLISLPIMLRYGYNRTIATGTITASGTLAQAIPPSLVLIVLADQLGKSVGDMYAGALIPGLLLVGLYLLFVFAVAIVRPSWVPALPPEARVYRESSGASGYVSLVVLMAVCTAAGWGWAQVHDGLMKSWTEAMKSHAVAEAMVCSKSLARRRFRLSHARVRSTTQRRGKSSKPLAVSDRLMISMVHLPMWRRASRSLSPA
jgi:TRAP-type mannitol/chloroaromatic compound transport system permease large subunit